MHAGEAAWWWCVGGCGMRRAQGVQRQPIPTPPTHHPPISLTQPPTTRNPKQDEVVAYVRRRSSAFSRGRSRFRGVSGHAGRWEARIGSFGGRKNVRVWVGG